jgi:hypothetical protein
VNKILPTPFQKSQTTANLTTTTTGGSAKQLPVVPSTHSKSHTAYNFGGSLDNPAEYDYDYEAFKVPEPKLLPKVPDLSLASKNFVTPPSKFLPNPPVSKVVGAVNSYYSTYGNTYDDPQELDDYEYFDDGSTYKYTENENDLIAAGDIKNTNLTTTVSTKLLPSIITATTAATTTMNNNLTRNTTTSSSIYTSEYDNKTTAIMYNNNNYTSSVTGGGSEIGTSGLPSKIRIDNNHYNQTLSEQITNKTVINKTIDPMAQPQAKQASGTLLNGLGSIVNNSITNFLAKPPSTTTSATTVTSASVDPNTNKTGFFGINNVTSSLFSKNEPAKTTAPAMSSVNDYYTSGDSYGVNDSIMTTAPSTVNGYGAQPDKKTGGGRYLPKQQTTFGYDEEEEYVEDYDQQYHEAMDRQRNNTYDDVNQNQQTFDESHYNTYDPRTDCFNEEDEFKYLQETEVAQAVSTSAVTTTTTGIYTTSSSYVNGLGIVVTAPSSVADVSIMNKHQLEQQDSYEDYIIDRQDNQQQYSINEEDEEEYEMQQNEMQQQDSVEQEQHEIDEYREPEEEEEDMLREEDEFIEELVPSHIAELTPAKEPTIPIPTPRASIDNKMGIGIASAIASAADEMKLGGEKLLDITETSKKKSVTISGTTEEHPPRKLEISAKQRWHWAYNKIIMQLNVSNIFLNIYVCMCKCGRFNIQIQFPVNSIEWGHSNSGLITENGFL